jgi:hypothetical protein
MQSKISKSHAVLHSKIYQFPSLLSLLLETRRKYHKLPEQLTYSLSQVKDDFTSIIKNFPTEPDLNDAENWNIDDFNFPSELLADALCMMVSDTFCHIHSIREADKYCLPFIKDINKIFCKSLPDQKISNETTQNVITSTFDYIASCSVGNIDNDVKSKINKAALRCAKSYDNRYNMLSEPLAKEIIANYASIKASEFRKRNK